MRSGTYNYKQEDKLQNFILHIFKVYITVHLGLWADF